MKHQLLNVWLCNKDSACIVWLCTLCPLYTCSSLPPSPCTSPLLRHLFVPFKEITTNSREWKTEVHCLVPRCITGDKSVVDGMILPFYCVIHPHFCMWCFVFKHLLFHSYHRVSWTSPPSLLVSFAASSVRLSLSLCSLVIQRCILYDRSTC